MILKPTEALKIMAEYDCEMTRQALCAWMRSTKWPCPFGVYTRSDENNDRGTYTIFRGRLMHWLTCQDMAADYNAGMNHPDVPASDAVGESLNGYVTKGGR